MKGAESVELLLAETASALVSAWRQGIIEEKHLKNAVHAMALLSGTNIKFHQKKEILESSVEIAIKENLSVYDTVYIALAAKLKIPLLSMDRKKIEAARKYRVKVAEPSDFE